jgi:hypothetical protein
MCWDELFFEIHRGLHEKKANKIQVNAVSFFRKLKN